VIDGSSRGVFCDTSSLGGVNLEVVFRFPLSGGRSRKPEHGAIYAGEFGVCTHGSSSYI